MKTFFKSPDTWTILLVFWGTAILTALWGGHRLLLPGEVSRTFPYLGTLFFLPVLVGLHALLTHFVSRKVSFWAIGYGLLIVPFLSAYWPEESLLLALVVVPPALFFSSEQKLWYISLICIILLAILYIQEPVVFLLPAVILIAGYGNYWIRRNKWGRLAVLVIAIVLFFILPNEYRYTFIQPFRQLRPGIVLPDGFHYRLGLFVYLLFLLALLGNKLFNTRTKLIWFISGLVVFVFYTFFDGTALSAVSALLMAACFQFLYGFWFQQMVFFRAAKSAHFLTWILIGLHLGVYWYQLR